MVSTRRNFLKSTLATASIAACGLARGANRNVASSDDSITDTHVYTGHWPHQTLQNNTPASLVAALRRNKIKQAWLGTFDALFHKNIAGVNERLAQICSQSDGAMLIPFGAVNPTLPDWEEDIRRCHETFHMRGIRLHPNYHGYKLDDSRFTRLLQLATDRGLIVQLTVALDNEKHLWLNPQPPGVDITPLAKTLATIKGCRVVVSTGTATIEDALIERLDQLNNAYFEFRKEKSFNEIPSERIVFGSSGPLHSIESSLTSLKQVGLKDGDMRAIKSDNARRLLAIK